MNFFAYRLPKADEIVTGKSEEIYENNLCNGFAISTFTPEDNIVYVIPSGEAFDISELDALNNNEEHYTMPICSTTREEHRTEVEHIKRAIMHGSLKKAIAARCIVADRGSLSLSDAFKRLCAIYPDATVFCFHTDLHGTWIGATPELLLRNHGGETESIALAGTRVAGTAGEWDKKNIDEHNFVTLFIIDRFMNAGASVEVGKVYTKQAGPVEHRCQSIKGDVESAIKLALSLSPTPALSGYPQEQAVALIEESENFSRGCYGGFVGPISEAGEFDLYVNLRSMQVGKENVCLYVGGGITKDSEADDEWNETCRKAETLIKPLNITI